MPFLRAKEPCSAKWVLTCDMEGLPLLPLAGVLGGRCTRPTGDMTPTELQPSVCCRVAGEWCIALALDTEVTVVDSALSDEPPTSSSFSTVAARDPS